MKFFINKYRELNLGVKSSLWFLICSIFQKGISFITIPIFTRLLSPDEYGLYSIYLSWENIISIFATLNLSYQVFNNGMVKYSNKKDAYTSSMVGLTILSSFICLILMLVFNEKIFNFSGLNVYFIILMISDILFVGIISLLTVRERYDFKYKLIATITILSLFLNPVLGILLVLTFKEKVIARVISVVIVNFIFSLISLIILLKRDKNIVNKEYWKYALKIDLPLIPHYLAMILLSSSDRIMIGKICGNSYTAFYSIAYNAAMVMTILINSVNSSFNPWIYKKLKDKDYDVIIKITNYLLIIIGIISILPMFFSPEIVKILGDKEYYEAAYVMPIISSSVFITYLYSLFISVELFFEKSKYVTYGTVAATILNIVLNIIFINKYGYIAAGYTTLLSYLLLSVFHYFSVKKIMKENNISRLFNLNLIVIISIVVILIGLVIQLLYKRILIRYFIFMFLMLIILINIKNVKKILNILKNK